MCIYEQKTDMEAKAKCEELKGEVKKMILAAANDPQQQLNLIDDIQRLGVAYHFQQEIDTALQHMNATFAEYIGSEKGDDLHNASLCFRLLRQDGYPVSSGKFN